jgi:hypothetical protein
LSAGTRAVVSRIVPFVAVASAGVANVFLMRQKELKVGIMVQDKLGNDLGESRDAGFKAVSQVAISRVAVSGAVSCCGYVLVYCDAECYYESD